LNTKEYYGTETKKAISNFGFEFLPFELIKAYAEVKKACVLAIMDYEKRFTPEIFSVIIKAIDSIIDGQYNDQFVVPLQQGGAGTSINMNINEVIANLSVDIYKKEYNNNILINPIEDINKFQSTNDTFPTSVTILLLRKLLVLEKRIIELQEILIRKENEYQNILIIGRTEMQDALPIRLGQVFASWAGSIERDRWRINKLKERVRTIALGGTAIGTCFFAPKEYVYAVEKHLRLITGLPLTRSQNLTDEIANLDKLSELAGGIKIISENLYKISGDLLLYTSSFVGEIIHPNLQYGSTIMAAKTNPVILEFIRGLSIDVQSECIKISNFTQNGQLQLNPYLPFITKSFIYAFDSIEKAIITFIDKFLNIMEINNLRIEENLLNSKALLNSLISILGYDNIKKIEGLIDNEKPSSIEELKKTIIKNTNLSKEELDNHFDPVNITSFIKGHKK
jgi:aspartate ammonia-lyase